jgi:hypothetical protein
VGSRHSPYRRVAHRQERIFRPVEVDGNVGVGEVQDQKPKAQHGEHYGQSPHSPGKPCGPCTYPTWSSPLLFPCPFRHNATTLTHHRLLGFAGLSLVGHSRPARRRERSYRLQAGGSQQGQRPSWGDPKPTRCRSSAALPLRRRPVVHSIVGPCPFPQGSVHLLEAALGLQITEPSELGQASSRPLSPISANKQVRACQT